MPVYYSGYFDYGPSPTSAVMHGRFKGPPCLAPVAMWYDNGHFMTR